MTHLQAFAMLLACLAVSACGNKGDLFLVPSEATEADLESVDEVLDELEGELNERPLVDTPEATVPEDEDNKDDDDRRKKKTP